MDSGQWYVDSPGFKTEIIRFEATFFRLSRFVNFRISLQTHIVYNEILVFVQKTIGKVGRF